VYTGWARLGLDRVNRYAASATTAFVVRCFKAGAHLTARANTISRYHLIGWSAGSWKSRSTVTRARAALARP